MSGRRARIKPRTAVFLGCEGESEQSYGQFLNDALNEKGLRFHIEVVNLNPGTGDPRSRLLRAKKEIDKRTRNRTKFRHMAILIDSDQIDGFPQQLKELDALAAALNITIIWQTPCHEAFLLSHFEDHIDKAPPTAILAGQYLLRVWPDYLKPMTRQELHQKIAVDGAIRLAAKHPSFAEFLKNVGLL
jgi:hypothetical protein